MASKNISITKIEGTINAELHGHDFAQIICPVKNLEIMVNGIRYFATPEEIIIIPPFCLHRVVSLNSVQFHMLRVPLNFIKKSDFDLFPHCVNIRNNRIITQTLKLIFQELEAHEDSGSVNYLIYYLP